MCDSKSGDFGKIVKPLTVSLILLLAMAALAVQPAQAQEKGWILTQRNTNMGGDVYTYISNGGLKWCIPKVGVNIATAGPSWDVCVYNEKTKTSCTLSNMEFRQKLSEKNIRAAEFKANSWVKGSSTTISGLKATQYSMRVPASRRVNQVVQAECWLSDDITVPDQVAALLSEGYGLPKSKFFPLRFTYKTNDGRSGTVLDTYRSQTAPIPVTYFQAPQGYAVARSYTEVFMDDETKQIMNDMAAEAGFDTAPRAPQRTQPVQAPARKQGMMVRGADKPQGNNEQVSAGDQLSKMLETLKGGK